MAPDNVHLTSSKNHSLGKWGRPIDWRHQIRCGGTASWRYATFSKLSAIYGAKFKFSAIYGAGFLLGLRIEHWISPQPSAFLDITDKTRTRWTTDVELILARVFQQYATRAPTCSRKNNCSITFQIYGTGNGHKRPKTIIYNIKYHGDKA